MSLVTRSDQSGSNRRYRVSRSATISATVDSDNPLSAVASDNLGAKATNSISITVTSSPPAAVTILNPTFTGGAFRFSFATQAGYTYNAQFTPSLSAISWFTFTNVAGNGSVVQVTDSSPTNASRYYRVGAQ